jgi:hypothetical protein
MEGIGRLRKVKSKVKEGVEKIVEKSKERLESKNDDAGRDAGNDDSLPDKNVHSINEGEEAERQVNLEGRPELDQRDTHTAKS